MENLMNAKFTYEEEPEFGKDAKDVTEEKLSSIGKRVRNAVSKIYDDGKVYKVVFAKGYTQYGKEYRYARRNSEIGFVCMGATEEKEAIEKKEPRDMEYYMKAFKKAGIHTNGKDIPTYIDLEEDYKAAQEKKAKREEAKKSKEVKTEPKTSKVTK